MMRGAPAAEASADGLFDRSRPASRSPAALRVGQVCGSTRALDAAAEAAPTAVELQVVEEKSAPETKPVSVCE